TAVRAYEDDRILFSMSVWTSLAAFTHFVYAGESLHRQVMQQRRRWFEQFDGAYQTFWWIPREHLPTVEEARERLEHLRAHRETAFAFTLKTPFPAPDEANEGLPPFPKEGSAS